MDIASLLNGTTISFGNGTGNGTKISFGNGTTMSFGNGTGGFDIASIMNIFGGETKETINGTDMEKWYTKNTKFSVTVTKGNQTLTSGNVVFTIDNKEYVGHIGSDGVASVNLETLKPGTHYITAEYGQTIVKNTITVKKAIITKDVTKKYKKTGKFTVKLLDSKGKPNAKKTVTLKFKGKTYKIKTNSKGIATFNIPKNLKVGKYTIKTTYAGLTLSNKITVKK